MGKQRKWQINKKKLGLCISCGKLNIFRWSLCRKHYIERRKRQIIYQEENRVAQRLRCANWRKKNPGYASKYYKKLKKGN